MFAALLAACVAGSSLVINQNANGLSMTHYTQGLKDEILIFQALCDRQSGLLRCGAGLWSRYAIGRFRFNHQQMYSNPCSNHTQHNVYPKSLHDEHGKRKGYPNKDNTFDFQCHWNALFFLIIHDIRTEERSAPKPFIKLAIAVRKAHGSH